MHACWELPGCLFFHLSACRNFIHEGKLSQECKKEKKPLFFFCPHFYMSECSIYLIHLKAKVLRFNEFQADYLSLRRPRSSAPYLLSPPSLPSVDCENVLSNHLGCKGLLSLFCRIPSLCTYKIELPFIFLHVNTYPGMGYRIKPDLFGRKATWYPSINMCDCTILTGSLPILHLKVKNAAGDFIKVPFK